MVPAMRLRASYHIVEPAVAEAHVAVLEQTVRRVHQEIPSDHLGRNAKREEASGDDAPASHDTDASLSATLFASIPDPVDASVRTEDQHAMHVLGEHQRVLPVVPVELARMLRAFG
jgi:hypothetical protein